MCFYFRERPARMRATSRQDFFKAILISSWVLLSCVARVTSTGEPGRAAGARLWGAGGTAGGSLTAEEKLPQGQGRVAGPWPVSANSLILGKPHPGLQACHPQNEGVGLDSGGYRFSV